MLSRYEAFSHAISSINRYIQKIERDEMVRYGCKGAFAQYLAAMVQHPEGLTAAQLCEIFDKDKAAVSRTVNEMEESGLLTRTGGHAGYHARLQLTPEGHAAAGFVCRRAQQAVEAGGQGLSAESREAFYAALHLIAANLEALCEQGLPDESF